MSDDKKSPEHFTEKIAWAEAGHPGRPEPASEPQIKGESMASVLEQTVQRFEALAFLYFLLDADGRRFSGFTLKVLLADTAPNHHFFCAHPRKSVTHFIF
jgi:hypothetical protein